MRKSIVTEANTLRSMIASTTTRSVRCADLLLLRPRLLGKQQHGGANDTSFLGSARTEVYSNVLWPNLSNPRLPADMAASSFGDQWCSTFGSGYIPWRTSQYARSLAPPLLKRATSTDAATFAASNGSRSTAMRAPQTPGTDPSLETSACPGLDHNTDSPCSL